MNSHAQRLDAQSSQQKLLPPSSSAYFEEKRMSEPLGQNGVKNFAVPGLVSPAVIGFLVTKWTPITVLIAFTF